MLGDLTVVGRHSSTPSGEDSSASGATLDYERIRAHYELALPWLLRHFGGTPVVRVMYPNGPQSDPVFHKDLSDAPQDVAMIDVRTSTGLHRYARLETHAVRWMCAAQNVVELDGWSPTLDDPDRAAFGRIILAPSGTATDDDVRGAAELIRDALAAQRLQAILMLDGFRRASLWIPFDDRPAYAQLGPWLHDFAATLAGQHPDVITTAALKAERGNRVYLGTKSNYPGMGSLLPYALRGTPSLEVSIPVPWSDLATMHNGTVTAAGFAEYARLFGDVFARLRSSIGRQVFGERALTVHVAEIGIFLAAPEPSPKGYIIAAALAVLADESRTTPTTFSRKRSRANCCRRRPRASTCILRCTSTSCERSAWEKRRSSFRLRERRSFGSTNRPTRGPPSHYPRCPAG